MFSPATITHMLQSNEFDELIKSGAIRYLENADEEIVLTYTSGDYEVVVTNVIKMSKGKA